MQAISLLLGTAVILVFIFLIGAILILATMGHFAHRWKWIAGLTIASAAVGWLVSFF